MSVRVRAPGLFATVQDLGRGGRAALGIARSGALDRGASRLANRLVGNAEPMAVVEVTMGGFRAVAEHDAWFAVTGAWGPIRLEGRTVDPYVAHPWPSGAELSIGWFERGARGYLAVRGGIDVAPVVGSRSSDVLSGLGPPPLAEGDLLPIGRAPRSAIPPAVIAPWSGPADGVVRVEIAPGPRSDLFRPSVLGELFETTWRASTQADRVGVRLDGPELARERAGELPSEGMIPGALQVPPSGRPTILLADGPVTGGYPVIAVVTDAALDAIGQVRPGTSIRFHRARLTSGGWVS